MNKSELIDTISSEADISKAAAERALTSAMNAIMKAVAEGDRVTLVGFGTFHASKRASRTGLYRREDRDRRGQRAQVHPRRRLQGRRQQGAIIRRALVRVLPRTKGHISGPRQEAPVSWAASSAARHLAQRSCNWASCSCRLMIWPCQ